jgi:predicted nuclease with TOPRIM domain
LAIAQNALRALVSGTSPATSAAGPSPELAILDLVRDWLGQGTLLELRGTLDGLEREVRERRDKEAHNIAEREALDDYLEQLEQDKHRLTERIARLDRERGQIAAQLQLARCEIAELADQNARLNNAVAREKQRQLMRARSLRWLIGSIRAEILRRWQQRRSG